MMEKDKMENVKIICNPYKYTRKNDTRKRSNYIEESSWKRGYDL